MSWNIGSQTTPDSTMIIELRTDITGNYAILRGYDKEEEALKEYHRLKEKFPERIWSLIEEEDEIKEEYYENM